MKPARILLRAFPQGFEFLGPVIFSAGMVIAGITTFVVTVEVISYFVLDMFGYAWHHTRENKRFRRTVTDLYYSTRAAGASMDLPCPVQAAAADVYQCNSSASGLPGSAHNGEQEIRHGRIYQQHAEEYYSAGGAHTVAYLIGDQDA